MIDYSHMRFCKPVTIKKTPKPINKISEKNKEEMLKLKKIKKSILSEANSLHTNCEYCKKNCQSLELHHIIYRSECMNHPEKHSKINSLLLCRTCHKLMHDHKDLRNKYIKERKLWETFDFIKKENYE